MNQIAELVRICESLRNHTVCSKETNWAGIHVQAKAIVRDFLRPGTVPLFIIVQDGANRFGSDLIGYLDNWFPLEVAYVKAKSYYDIYPGKLYFDALGLDEARVRGRNVVIVEDIIDTGFTIKAVSEYVLSLNPKIVKIATLIDKRSRRVVNPPREAELKYVVHPELDGAFFVGYGMDFMNMFRPMNHIAILTDDLRARVARSLEKVT